MLTTDLIVTWVLAREEFLFFCSDEAVGLHKLSILLARLIDCPACLRFCTLTALRRGETGIPDDAEPVLLSELRRGTDFTICVLRGSMSAKLTWRDSDNNPVIIWAAASIVCVYSDLW